MKKQLKIVALVAGLMVGTAAQAIIPAAIFGLPALGFILHQCNKETPFERAIEAFHAKDVAFAACAKKYGIEHQKTSKAVLERKKAFERLEKEGTDEIKNCAFGMENGQLVEDNIRLIIMGLIADGVEFMDCYPLTNLIRYRAYKGYKKNVEEQGARFWRRAERNADGEIVYRPMLFLD